MLAHLGAGECCEGYGLRKRPGPERAHIGERNTARLGEEGAPHEPADTTLIGSHPEGCIPLHVLEVLIALAARETHVIRGHIVLQVDERLTRRTHLPQRHGRRDLRVRWQLESDGGVRGSSELYCKCTARRITVADRRREPRQSARRTGDNS